MREVAALLGRDKSILYDAIRDGDFPLPVVRLRRQIFVPRAAVERLVNGVDPVRSNGKCPNCGQAG